MRFANEPHILPSGQMRYLSILGHCIFSLGPRTIRHRCFFTVAEKEKITEVCYIVVKQAIVLPLDPQTVNVGELPMMTKLLSQKSRNDETDVSHGHFGFFYKEHSLECPKKSRAFRVDGQTMFTAQLKINNVMGTWPSYGT